MCLRTRLARLSGLPGFLVGAGSPQATDLLFRVNPNGTLIPLTLSRPPDPQSATPSSSWARAEAERRSNGGLCVT